eukprot:CAMPEP_0169151056 /NCGR_PEP_ID=MMETSP1015-20121227/50572_1 /TAXON_ID=342587 /ORGANISM="Karlodinium micrum, Strain CCMP2283" /LENGTH=42 /DNA_ID= /DNA_START= /DNA_END= /DNA_ORIENTATION=
MAVAPMEKPNEHQAECMQPVELSACEVMALAIQVVQILWHQP